MISKTKKELSNEEIKALAVSGGFQDIENIHPLGAGEFNAVYAFDTNGKAYVLKIAPTAETPVMTYEKNMMRSEIFWYEQLRMHTDVALPEIVHTDNSRTLQPSDFFIMQRIPGKQMNEMQFSPDEKAKAVALLPQIAAKMHHIKNNAFGYPQTELYDTWAKALFKMTEAHINDAAAAGQTCENGEKMLRYIRKHETILQRVQCCMVNFDLWESNVICERTANDLRFVMIDPERGFWGDPVMDFVCFEPDKPLNKKTFSMNAYNKLADRAVTTGREETIRFAFAQAYLGIIMEVERYYRYIPGDEGWIRNDRVCRQLFSDAFTCLEETAP